MHLLKVAGFASAVLTAFTAAPPPAHAVSVQIELIINFLPPNPILPPNPVVPSLIGDAKFHVRQGGFGLGDTLPPLIEIASINVDVAGPGSFRHVFFPTDPLFPADPIGCFACQLHFSFGGETGAHSVFAFHTGHVPGIVPSEAPILLTGPFLPPNPILPPSPIRSGVLFAFSTPVEVGTWEVRVSETPLPAAFALFPAGLILLGFLARRRPASAEIRVRD